VSGNGEVDILLVEDNLDDIELALHALRRERLANNIVCARDGEEALNFIFCTGPFSKRNFERPPRLVLLDLKLPKVSGLDVLKRMKQDPRTKPVPVVVLTSSREERDLVASYNLGANSYIQKPVDFDRFREIVKSAGLYWMVINERPLSTPAQMAALAGRP
jgi:CheY-like chemotaxis protein